MTMIDDTTETPTILTNVVALERERDDQDMRLHNVQCSLDREIDNLVAAMKDGNSIPPSAMLVIARNGPIESAKASNRSAEAERSTAPTEDALDALIDGSVWNSTTADQFRMEVEDRINKRLDRAISEAS